MSEVKFNSSKELAEFIITGYYEGKILKAEDAAQFIDAFVNTKIISHDNRQRLMDRARKMEEKAPSVFPPLPPGQTPVARARVSPRRF